MNDFLVIIDADSGIGANLLGMLMKIGGASGTANCGAKQHPFIYCNNIDWVSCQPHVKLNHLVNPGQPGAPSRVLIVPASAILFAATPMQDAIHAAPTDQAPVRH